MAAASDATWFKIAADTIATTPVIFVGCSLQEPDLEYYLARRAGLAAGSSALAPSIFVTPSLDKVNEAQCRRYGLVPVPATSDAFFEEISRTTGARKRPLELLSPRAAASELLPSVATARQRIFFRQWTLVADGELPLAPDKLAPLLRVTEPTWQHITGEEDIVRQTTKDLAAEVENWLTNLPKPDRRGQSVMIRTLIGGAGDGKSTVLLRTLYEARRSVLSFWFSGLERLDWEVAVEVFAGLKVPFVFVVDSAAEHAHQVGSLIRETIKRGASFFCIISDRESRLQHLMSTVGDLVRSSRMDLKVLSSKEAQELIRRLFDMGLLGRKAGQPHKKLAGRLENQSLAIALLELECSSGTVDASLLDEYDHLPDDAKPVYAIIAMAHSLGYSVKTAIVERASNVRVARILALLSGPLSGLIVALDVERLETRHRQIAELLMRTLPVEFRAQIASSLISALEPYVNRKAIMRRTMEARLAGRLLDIDNLKQLIGRSRLHEFYNSIRDGWSWNSRYWEQRALLALAVSPVSPSDAINYALQAVGIERHPMPLTTLAKVYFEVAAMNGDNDDGWRMVNRAFDVIDEALDASNRRQRKEIHPYDVGVRGAAKYLRAVRSTRNFTELRDTEARAWDLLGRLESTGHFTRADIETLDRTLRGALESVAGG